MFGFGTKITHVFANRWKAVTWSLGMLMTAYCTVPSQDDGSDQPEVAVVKAAMPHKSPWAKN